MDMDHMPQLVMEDEFDSGSTMPPVFDYLEDEDNIIVDDIVEDIPTLDSGFAARYEFPAAVRQTVSEDYPPPCPSYIANRKRGVQKPLVEPYVPVRRFIRKQKYQVTTPRIEQLAVQFDPEEIDVAEGVSGTPYCRPCNKAFKSWTGYEYHILSFHLDYRPFRCIVCKGMTFSTEPEGRFHMAQMHPAVRAPLYKTYIDEKEEAAQMMFENAEKFQEEGIMALLEDIKTVRDTAKNQINKYGRLRFKIPHCVQEFTVLRESSVQTGMDPSENSYISQPIPRSQIQMVDSSTGSAEDEEEQEIDEHLEIEEQEDVVTDEIECQQVLDGEQDEQVVEEVVEEEQEIDQNGDYVENVVHYEEDIEISQDVDPETSNPSAYIEEDTQATYFENFEPVEYVEEVHTSHSPNRQVFRYPVKLVRVQEYEEPVEQEEQVQDWSYT